eukprot:11766497-Alexandrium_andersonii.AAC.1
MVEQAVGVPVSITEEEIVRVPTVANHHRHHHTHVEQIVGVEAPQVRAEVVHVPKLAAREPVRNLPVEAEVEVPVPMPAEG